MICVFLIHENRWKFNHHWYGIQMKKKTSKQNLFQKNEFTPIYAATVLCQHFYVKNSWVIFQTLKHTQWSDFSRGIKYFVNYNGSKRFVNGNSIKCELSSSVSIVFHSMNESSYIFHRTSFHHFKCRLLFNLNQFCSILFITYQKIICHNSIFRNLLARNRHHSRV